VQAPTQLVANTTSLAAATPSPRRTVQLVESTLEQSRMDLLHAARRRLNSSNAR
jgi:hypothetical protein